MAFVECNGRTIGYDDSGEADLPAMLFAHPLGMSRQVWTEVTTRLRGRWRCIAWDLPGHGNSAPVAHALSAHDLAADAHALYLTARTILVLLSLEQLEKPCNSKVSSSRRRAWCCCC